MIKRSAGYGLALVLAAAAIAAPSAMAGEGWRVMLRGQDVTREAAPDEAGGVPFVDVSALAPALGLTVRVEQMQLEIRDGAGVPWRGRPGASLLESVGRAIPLAAPWRVEGASVRLPVAAVAVLAGLDLALDPDSRIARLEATALPVPGETLTGDWQLLTIAKPPSGEPGSPLDPFARPPAVALLPPTSETLRFNAGMGFVQAGDGGGDINASGSVFGLDTQLATLMSHGTDGLRLDYGRLALVDRATGWHLQAGDLFSEVAGSARGLSLGFDRAGRHRLGVALYLPDEHPGGREQSVLALRDELVLGDRGLLSAEAASDGSSIVRGRFSQGKLSLSGYRRGAGDDGVERDGFGLSASLGLLADLGLHAAYQRTGSGARRFEFWNLGLRAPLHPKVDLQLEASGTESDRHRSELQALGAFVPLGALHLHARVQRQSGHTTSLQGLMVGREELATFASASYTLPRLQLGVQLARFVPEAGEVTGYQQAVASWTLSRATRLTFVGTFDEEWEASDFRFGLRHVVSNRLELGLEYGRIPDFQSSGLHLAGLEPEERFKLTIRTRWDVAAPAGGGVVEGRVRDRIGRPLPALPVLLGDYRTFSDEAGEYRFSHVPGGAYELALDEANLPASFAPAADGRSVVVTGRGRQVADLTAVPLGSVTGRVGLDGVGGGRGMAGVLVLLDDRATRTGADGSFAFRNVQPGEHLLRLDSSRLPIELVARAPTVLMIGMPPGRSLEDVSFQLDPRQRLTTLQEVP